MFKYDRPIESLKEDFLDREKFAKNLSESLINWTDKESFVMALNGNWGSGKSSVINLTKQLIQENKYNNKPTIIEFNPWEFSDSEKLGDHFFIEIARALEIKNASNKDKKTAKKLRLFASLLSCLPSKQDFSTIPPLVMNIGFISLLSGYFGDNIVPLHDWIKNLLIYLGGIGIILGFIATTCSKISDFLFVKSDIFSKSAQEVKADIKKALEARSKKIVIIIDDIDRLSQSEIKQLFKLIRVNADFPNTLYLLAFDREVVAQNLQEQMGVSGEDYLSKIVQVSFDLPNINPNRINQYLFKELDSTLNILPKSGQEFFEENKNYWIDIFNSGFSEYFTSIRDVKRYINGLKFGLNQSHLNEVMEVNIIDFIALESIRTFAPDFYAFLRMRKHDFTSTNSSSNNKSINEVRKSDIESVINKLPSNIQIPTKTLIFRLFPQIESLFSRGYSSYGNEWQSNWSSELKICAGDNFDCYFNFIPGGGNEELSQFEIKEVIESARSLQSFEDILTKCIKQNKIRQVLVKMQNYAKDENTITKTNVENIIQTLFNISDNLPDNTDSMWDFGAHTDSMRLVSRLLEREDDKDKNFQFLQQAIKNSKSLYAPIERVSLESSREDKSGLLIPEDKIDVLKQECVNKLIETSKDYLLNLNSKFLYLLYRWKDWGSDNKLQEFISYSIDDNNRLISLLKHFIGESRSQIIGQYSETIERRFLYKELSNFTDITVIKNKLENVRNNNSAEYKNNKELIDLFLVNFDKRNSKNEDEE